MGENEMWSGNSIERHDGGRAVPEQLRRGFRWFDSTEICLWPCGLQGCGRANDEGHPRARAVFCVGTSEDGSGWCPIAAGRRRRAGRLSMITRVMARECSVGYIVHLTLIIGRVVFLSAVRA